MSDGSYVYIQEPFTASGDPVDETLTLNNQLVDDWTDLWRYQPLYFYQA